MSNLHKLFYTIVLLAVVLSGCTKSFTAVNTDPTKLTNVTVSDYPYMFAYAQTTSSYYYGQYETGECTFADIYAQYYEQAALSFNTDRYNIRQDWMPSIWNPVYTQAVPQLKVLREQTAAGTAENAVANIWWVWMFVRVSDYFGPVPYFQAGSGANAVAYTPQDSMYYDFFVKLDSAIAALGNHPNELPYGTHDMVFGTKTTSVSYWLKFANTLKLRIALRISGVAPVLAKQKAEEAVASGVMTSNSDNADMLKSTTTTLEYNGLATDAGWNTLRMSATMESILKGYSDPRMQYYFQPASMTGEYHGVRNGLTATEKAIDINSKKYNSNLGTRWVTGSDLTSWSSNFAVSQGIIHAPEAYFLRAEGALNGWNMNGTAQDLYEQGITLSMNQWGITDGTTIGNYVNNSSTPTALQDGQSSPAVNDYPVLWSSDGAMQRKQIAQQKWLALFPDGIEAWANLRRTGYPEIYPVIHNDNTDIPAGGRIRRLPFMQTERETNAAAVTAAESMLSGADNAATKLWWDLN